MSIALQEKQIEKIVEKTTLRFLCGIFADPDFNLELRKNFEQKLQKSIMSKKMNLLKDFEEIIADLWK